MNKRDLAEQLKYSSSDWIYIVTWNNLLKKLHTPFKVLVLIPIGQLDKGKVVWVELVKVTMDLKTVFVIDGNAYYYNYFEILID
ncbi:hypothetical protein QSE00_07905 [Arenibacter sp. M-2]|uniref:hypothetical protein n=1 Tax=Arenibacter sp. M-2 TaxID=3053612 RepID=UPI0025710AFA|nr:hypothetical protein [Arenibacter sp. M-2]MDL5511730.1 hypothetical protein [Arenibacter sp. M-2]